MRVVYTTSGQYLAACIVDDDKAFLQRLARAMETRGFTVTSCDSVSDGLAHIGKSAPAFAVVDLRLGDGNGLDVVSALKRERPDARAIVLTGYGDLEAATALLPDDYVVAAGIDTRYQECLRGRVVADAE